MTERHLTEDEMADEFPPDMPDTRLCLTDEQASEVWEAARAEEEGEWVEDGPEPGEECGRWVNGRLTESCSKAGSEECDFECPHRGSLYG